MTRLEIRGLYRSAEALRHPKSFVSKLLSGLGCLAVQAGVELVD
jgi:hypothetical protein